MEARRCLDKIGARALGTAASLDNLLVAECGGFENHLEHARSWCRGANRCNLSFARGPIASESVAQINDHIHLASTVRHGHSCLGRLDLGRMLTTREAANGGDNDLAALDMYAAWTMKRRIVS